MKILLILTLFLLSTAYSQCDANGDGNLDITDILTNVNCILTDCWEEDTTATPFAMLSVPAGDYTYGSNDDIQNIDYDYEIMKYEVTNSEYLTYLESALSDGSIWLGECLDYWEGDECINGNYAGDNQYPEGEYTFYSLDDPWGNADVYNYSFISWEGSQFILNNSTFMEHPVVWVSWFGAHAFAQHYGLRLPDEYEWEKAARGMTGADYPWGEEYGDDISDNANYYISGDPWDNGTTPVGYYNGENSTTDSPSPYGAYDMAGNVWNWTHSWWSESSSYRVIRGGSWCNDADLLRSWARGYYFYPGYGIIIVGFRCVRTQ